MRLMNLFLIVACVACIIVFSSVAFAGGTVSYTDGTPAARAKVIVHDGEKGKRVVVCDPEGRFELGALPENGSVQIRADSKDYAPLRLPARLFESGNMAIVLQPKTAKVKQ